MKEQYVTQDQLIRIEKRIEKLEKLFRSDPADSVLKRNESIREFVLRKNPANDVQKTLCILYFLERHADGAGGSDKGFSSEDVRVGFQNAREKVPANVADKIKSCAEKGWIDQADAVSGKKYWTLTNTGISFAENMGEDNEQ